MLSGRDSHSLCPVLQVGALLILEEPGLISIHEPVVVKQELVAMSSCLHNLPLLLSCSPCTQSADLMLWQVADGRQLSAPVCGCIPIDGGASLPGGCWIPSLDQEVALDIVEDAVVVILGPALKKGVFMHVARTRLILVADPDSLDLLLA